MLLNTLLLTFCALGVYPIIVCSQTVLPGATPAAPVSEVNDQLRTRSAALSSEQRDSASALFATGFSLWQSGDFDAASRAFKRGLDIDPANPQANYYLGDCLRRSKQRKEAQAFFARAVAFGGQSPEAFKAETALEQLAKEPSVDELLPEEILEWAIGTWKDPSYPMAMKSSRFTIYRDQDGKIAIKGTGPCYFGCAHYQNLSISGPKIQFELHGNGIASTYNLQLSNASKMEGSKDGYPVVITKVAATQ
jgi:tetratricopeptide (TPR) repeat protein